MAMFLDFLVRKYPSFKGTKTRVYLVNNKCRLVICIMIFLTFCCNYMLRVNLNINLIAMVPFTNETNSSPQYTMSWTIFQRANVLSSFSWGYVCGLFMSIWIIEHVGPRKLILTSMISSSLLTLLSPIAAKYDCIALIVIRIIMGLTSSFLYPSYSRLIAKWAVDTERGKFSCSSIVGTSGTFFGWITCGPIIERFGWEWGFYVYGIIGLLVSIAVYCTVYDTPIEHPRISFEELTWIREGISDKRAKPKQVPYLKILTSIPCWSFFILEFGQGWCVYITLTAVPHFMASALSYATTSTSLLSALTYLARCSAALMSGYLGDYFTKTKLSTVNVLRKSGCVLSHIVPGILILCLAIQVYDSAYYVALVVLAMFFNGFVVFTSNLVAFDLAINYVGALASISTMIHCMSGIFLPFVTAYFTQGNENDLESWHPVFYTASSFYILSAVQFILFGSTKTQKWNNCDDK